MMNPGVCHGSYGKSEEIMNSCPGIMAKVRNMAIPINPVIYNNSCKIRYFLKFSVIPVLININE